MRRAPVLALLLALLATALPAAAQTPLRFARGASSAEVAGVVARGETAAYTLGARAGQHMTVRIASTEGNAVFQLYAPGAKLGPEGVSGTALPGAGEGEEARSWEGTLPANGTYLLVVGATRGGASYRLDVLIK